MTSRNKNLTTDPTGDTAIHYGGESEQDHQEGAKNTTTGNGTCDKRRYAKQKVAPMKKEQTRVTKPNKDEPGPLKRPATTTSLTSVQLANLQRPAAPDRALIGLQ